MSFRCLFGHDFRDDRGMPPPDFHATSAEGAFGWPPYNPNATIYYVCTRCGVSREGTGGRREEPHAN